MIILISGFGILALLYGIYFFKIKPLVWDWCHVREGLNAYQYGDHESLGLWKAWVRFHQNHFEIAMAKMNMETDIYATRLIFSDYPELKDKPLYEAVVLWEKFKHERREREEKKMELEAGKYYETKKVGTVACKQGPNGSLYLETVGGVKHSAYLYISDILREVPEPLTLIPGELYAMEGGKVEVCRESEFGGVRLGNAYYELDGKSIFHNGPKPLHRLKVNEHMKSAPGQRFQDAVKAAASRMGAIRGAAINDLIDSGYLAPYQIYDFGNEELRLLQLGHNKRESMITAMLAKQRSLSAVEAKDALEANDARAAMPRVTYKSHTDCNHREPIVPEGYERVAAGSIRTTDMLMPGFDGEWRGVPRCITPDLFVIRPIAKPFKITGPGWYRTRRDGWLKLPLGQDARVRLSDSMWTNGGSFMYDGSCSQLDLIARATPSQAAILDAL